MSWTRPLPYASQRHSLKAQVLAVMPAWSFHTLFFQLFIPSPRKALFDLYYLFYLQNSAHFIYPGLESSAPEVRPQHCTIPGAKSHITFHVPGAPRSCASLWSCSGDAHSISVPSPSLISHSTLYYNLFRHRSIFSRQKVEIRLVYLCGPQCSTCVQQVFGEHENFLVTTCDPPSHTHLSSRESQSL